MILLNLSSFILENKLHTRKIKEILNDNNIKGTSYYIYHKKYVVERKNTVAENGNTQLKYLKFVFKNIIRHWLFDK